MRKRLREQADGHDALLARVGGEEFALLLPGLAADAAATLAEDMRAGLIATPLPLPVNASAVRASIGVAALVSGEMGEALYLRADRALYRAKAEGRDRVCRADG